MKWTNSERASFLPLAQVLTKGRYHVASLSHRDASTVSAAMRMTMVTAKVDVVRRHSRRTYAASSSLSEKQPRA